MLTGGLAGVCSPPLQTRPHGTQQYRGEPPIGQPFPTVHLISILLLPSRGFWDHPGILQWSHSSRCRGGLRGIEYEPRPPHQSQLEPDILWPCVREGALLPGPGPASVWPPRRPSKWNGHHPGPHGDGPRLSTPRAHCNSIQDPAVLVCWPVGEWWVEVELGEECWVD